MTSLHVICGLGLPNQKFWLRLEIEDCLKIFFEDIFFENTCGCVLGPGLEHSCPWPREGLSSERLSLALVLASDFFCVLGLGLEPCVLESTSANRLKNFLFTRPLQYQNGTSLFNSLSFNQIIGYLEYRLQNFVLEHKRFIENVSVKPTSRLLGKQ